MHFGSNYFTTGDNVRPGRGGWPTNIPSWATRPDCSSGMLTYHYHKFPIVELLSQIKVKIYSCVFNTSHTVLGDMPNFYEKPVCITRHAIPFYERPGCNTEHTNSLLMWQWHHYCFEVTREGLRPGCNSRHGTLFTKRPGWNKRIWGEIQWVLNRSPVTCIQD